MKKSALQPRSRKTPTGGRMTAKMILMMSEPVKGILARPVKVDLGILSVGVGNGAVGLKMCLLLSKEEEKRRRRREVIKGGGSDYDI